MNKLFLVIQHEIENNIASTCSFVDKLTIIDDSYKHAGHDGYRLEGASHIRLVIISEDSSNLTKLQKHRKIIAAIKPIIEQYNIHSVTINFEKNE